MKKNIIIIILTIIVLVLGGYFGYEKFIKKSNDEVKNTNKINDSKEQNKDEIKDNDNTSEDTNNINITINSKYDNNKVLKHSNVALFKDIVFTNIYYYNNKADESGMYELYNEVYMNNTKIVDEHMAVFADNLDQINYYIEKYDKEFEISSFNDSTTDDKYVLLNYFYGENTCPVKENILLNQNGSILGEYSYTGNCGWNSLVFNSFDQARNEVADVTVNQIEGKYYLFNEKSVYINSNKIYSLENSEDCENVLLNVYTVENGIVKKKLVKSYSANSSVVSQGGQC